MPTSRYFPSHWIDIILALSAIRFALITQDTITSLSQLDFSGCYTAGSAILQNLNPYLNHYPYLWDGSNTCVTSRWLYHPFATLLFIPFSFLTYTTAKLIWTYCILLFLGIAIFSAERTLTPRLTKTQWKISSIGLLWFFPLLTEILAGQTNTFLLLLLTLSWIWGARDSYYPIFSGLLLAILILVKMNFIVILPFYFFRLKWKALAYAGISLLLLIGGTYISLGKELNDNYYKVQMPRISKCGPYSNQHHPGIEPLLAAAKNASQTQVLEQKLFPTYTTIQEKTYLTKGIAFATNGSLSRLLFILCFAGTFEKIEDAPISFSVIFITLASIGLLLFFVLEIKSKLLFTRLSPEKSLYELFLAISFVLLTSPLTWVMNLTMLSPMIFLLPHLAAQKGIRSNSFIFAGIILIGIPEVTSLSNNALVLNFTFGEIKYLLGLLLMILGLSKIIYDQKKPNHPNAAQV